DTGLAAGTGRQVDDHAPFVLGVLERRVESQRPERALELRVFLFFVPLRREARVLVILLKRAGADDLAVLHDLVLLRAGNRLARAGLADRQAGSKPGTIGRAQRVGIEADGRLGAAADLA